MVSVERPSEMGAPHSNVNSVLHLMPLKLMSITRKDFSFFAMYLNLKRLRFIAERQNSLWIARFH